MPTSPPIFIPCELSCGTHLGCQHSLEFNGSFTVLLLTRVLRDTAVPQVSHPLTKASMPFPALYLETAAQIRV